MSSSAPAFSKDLRKCRLRRLQAECLLSALALAVLTILSSSARPDSYSLLVTPINWKSAFAGCVLTRTSYFRCGKGVSRLEIDTNGVSTETCGSTCCQTRILGISNARPTCRQQNEPEKLHQERVLAIGSQTVAYSRGTCFWFDNGTGPPVSESTSSRAGRA